MITDRKGQGRLFVCRDGCLMVLGRRWRSKWWQLSCFGPKRHYRKDGSCEHTAELLGHLVEPPPERVRVSPFGGRNERTRAA